MQEVIPNDFTRIYRLRYCSPVNCPYNETLEFKMMEFLIIVSIAFLSFLAGNLIGFNEGMKKTEALYKKYL